MRWLERYTDWVADLPPYFGLPLFIWTIMLPGAVFAAASLAVPITVVYFAVRCLR